MIRTFIDSGVLIAAFTSRVEPTRAAALRVLNDPSPLFISAEFVRLEVLPKPIFHREALEREALERFFAQEVGEWVGFSDGTLTHAYDCACRYGLGALDALHAAMAIEGRAQEFITREKPTKPLFRVREFKTICIAASFANPPSTN